LATAALAIGCSGNPQGEPVGTSSAAISPISGCDYSFARPSPSSLVSMGYAFAARYLSGDPGGGKDITSGEAGALLGAGLDIVLVWETSGTEAQNGYDQGVSDAEGAQSEAATVGQPTTRPIYFAVDFDADSSQAGAIDAYFQGVASVIGLSRTGVYGGYYIVNQLFDAGLITFGWQTYAWSGGAWDSRAQLRQVENGVDDDQLDADLGMVADYGQWPIAPPPPSATRGWLDSVSCDQLAGWAQDPNSPTTSIPVDIYVDGPAGSGTGLGRFPAANDRSDLCSAIGSCNHGFTIQPPATLYDGHAHTVYAYGIAVTPGATNSLLSGAPKTLHCASALTGDFDGTGRTEVVQFRDDWQTLPLCGRWGSDWSCDDRAATYIGGVGAGNAGTAIYAGGTALIGDANGDGRDDVLEFNAAWTTIPACFSTDHGWACENLDADYLGGLGAGNGGSGIYPGATPLVGDVNGDGKADVVEYDPSWASFPVCFATDHGWACENLEATYVSGLGAGNAKTGVYGAAFGTGTTVLVADVNGDGKADVIQFNPAWLSIPVCFSTGHGWSCENLEATYAGGLNAGNSGSGIYGATTVKATDVNGDGKADIVQYNPAWHSIPVCFSTGHGWSCENQEATYVGGIGAGNSGSGIYGTAFGASTMLVADLNGDGDADVVQYSEGWESIPVCFSTEHGWACENLRADGSGSASKGGNAGSAIYPFGVPLAGTFDGGKASGIVQIDPDSGWTTLPICNVNGSAWSCSNASATVY
jgi:hypothetical protein